MNVLKPHLQTTIWTLLKGGATQREIARITGISRHTIRAYQQRFAADPANCPGVATDPPSQTAPPRPPTSRPVASPLATSKCEPHRAFIDAQLRLGRNATAIYQDLVDLHGFDGAYNSVKRFCAQLRHKEPEQFDRLHDVPLFREFAGLNWDTPVPDETTILRFRRLLEEHKLSAEILALINELLSAKGLLLRAGTVVDATLIAAPSSTKNALGERDPQMKQSKKGKQWYFGMKAHIGVDADSGLVHTVRGTAGNVGDVVEANTLLHGQEAQAWGDAGYQGADKRPDAKSGVRWNIAMRPGKRRALDKTKLLDSLTDQLERIKASIRAKVEHPFRVIKRQFGHVKVRYRGLAKNTAQLNTLFALSNLWMARRTLMGARA